MSPTNVSGVKNEDWNKIKDAHLEFDASGNSDDGK